MGVVPIGNAEVVQRIFEQKVFFYRASTGGHTVLPEYIEPIVSFAKLTDKSSIEVAAEKMNDDHTASMIAAAVGGIIAMVTVVGVLRSCQRSNNAELVPTTDDDDEAPEKIGAAE